MQVSQAKEALSREQRLKEQLREQLTTAAEESKRQVWPLHAHAGHTDSGSISNVQWRYLCALCSSLFTGLHRVCVIF